MRSLLLCIIMLGCSTTPTQHGPEYNWPYVGHSCTVRSIEQKFYREMAERGLIVLHPIRAKIVDKIEGCVGPNVIGCTSYGPGKPKIQLLRSFWNNQDCGWREALVFHEHAHADFYLSHEDGEQLMAPFIEQGYACLLKDRRMCIDHVAIRVRAMLIFIYHAKVLLLQTPRLYGHGDRVPKISQSPEGL